MTKIGNKEFYGIIYKITNIVNNKCYIGQTTKKNGFLDRYPNRGSGIERVYKYHKARKDKGQSYNVYLLRSIEKYGFDGFIVDEVFDTADNQIELDEKEIKYIKQFDSFYNGYNMTLGGGGVVGLQGISGKEHALSKRVCQISLSGELIKIWDCLNDIERETKIFATNITRACKGQLKVVNGYVWVYADEYDPSINYARTPKARPKPVVLLDDKSQNILEEYDNMKIAAQKLKISQTKVANICKHKTQKRDYNLYFKSEYIEDQRLNEKKSS